MTNPPGIKVTHYKPHQLDRCNFQCAKLEKGQSRDVECGVTAVTCVILTDAGGRSVLIKMTLPRDAQSALPQTRTCLRIARCACA